MKVRWLGHSCIEIIGQNHILIDPDYLREPLPDIDYIFITHGHEDHLGKVAEIQAGAVLAAKDVCEITRGQEVPMRRLFAVEPGDVVENVRVLVGYSSVGLLSELWARLRGRRHEFAGGTPLSFLVEDDPSTCPWSSGTCPGPFVLGPKDQGRQVQGPRTEGSGHGLSFLHPGDGHKAPQGVNPDIFCLPYRHVAWRDEWYQRQLTALVESLHPRYVIPIHHDIPPWQADPQELVERVSAQVVVPTEWVEFT